MLFFPLGIGPCTNTPSRDLFRGLLDPIVLDGAGLSSAVLISRMGVSFRCAINLRTFKVLKVFDSL